METKWEERIGAKLSRADCREHRMGVRHLSGIRGTSASSFVPCHVHDAALLLPLGIRSDDSILDTPLCGNHARNRNL